MALKIGMELQYNDGGHVRRAILNSFNDDGTVNVSVYDSTDNPHPSQRTIIGMGDAGTPLYLHDVIDPDEVMHTVLFGKAGIRLATDPTQHGEDGACWVTR